MVTFCSLCELVKFTCPRLTAGEKNDPEETRPTDSVRTPEKSNGEKQEGKENAAGPSVSTCQARSQDTWAGPARDVAKASFATFNPKPVVSTEENRRDNSFGRSFESRAAFSFPTPEIWRYYFCIKVNLLIIKIKLLDQK